MPWVHANPLPALRHAAVWTQLLGVVAWVADHEGPPVYLRQVDVPRVDTKFLEAHRGLLSSMLEAVLPLERVNSGAPRGDLAARFGFRLRPDSVRLRTLDPRLPLVGGFTELTARAEELRVPPAAARRVLVVENEITYLALPESPGTLALLGGGYGVTRLGRLPWLHEVQLLYWGDLDTHGFAIVSELRARLPHTRTLLMDRETLLDHRDHWVREPRPSRARLPHLTDAEQEMYADLQGDTYAPSLRLEQERIRFGAVRRALAGA